MHDQIRPSHDETLLRRFDYHHLSEGPERDLAASYAMVADLMAETLPVSPHVTRCLSALLDARRELGATTTGLVARRDG
ncbi:hypothetical protein QE364_001459 [Nocardioides zeae]|uniref:Uncharacterized protein n=2 Tax=Nocardioides zeae TaxID=1457234 RepID=A0AAJ1TWE1_9ACTN|nr:hypothetical protein [Nocardioides zeae]MDQ1103531.1 hypothetical protein [Nocardioides zeae]MDR6172749.1 hypothetical protein [Nocardioides zeae]MDR6209759.1 hypothetical protein [Nocardioides zeae]